MRKGAERGAAGISSLERAEVAVSGSPGSPHSDSSFVGGSSHDSSPTPSSPANGGFDPRGRRLREENAGPDSHANGNNYRQRQRLAKSANNRIGSPSASLDTGTEFRPVSRGSPSKHSRNGPNRSSTHGQHREIPQSSDDLLQFDTPSQGTSRSGGSKSNDVLEALLRNDGGSSSGNRVHNVSSSVSSDSAVQSDTGGSKDDILRLFDQPQQQQHMSQGYVHHGMYYAPSGGGLSGGFSQQPTMGGMSQYGGQGGYTGYGGHYPMFPPNGGMPPAMYNSGGFGMPHPARQTQTQRQQQQQQQSAQKKW